MKIIFTKKKAARQELNTPTENNKTHTHTREMMKKA